MDIASMLEVEVQEVVESKENVTQSHISNKNFPSTIVSQEENDFYKLTYGSDIACIRFLRIHCTACDEHIGSAPADAPNMNEHPVLLTLICGDCREFYGDGRFDRGDDNTDMFCRWCANGGNLFCCSYCSNTFCSKCIKRNFDPQTLKRIEADECWKCFVCDAKDLFPLRSFARALITHIATVSKILENDKKMSTKDIDEKMHLDESKCCSRKRKRQNRLSYSVLNNKDTEDLKYANDKQLDASPSKKQKLNNMQSPYNNVYLDHEYYCSNNSSLKIDTDIDPTDILIPCEQTMIEGDMEIVNTDHLYSFSARKSKIKQQSSLHQQQQSKSHQEKLTSPQEQNLQSRFQEKQQIQSQKKQTQIQEKQQSQFQEKQHSESREKEKAQPQETQQPKLQQKKQSKSQQDEQQQLNEMITKNSVAINSIPETNFLTHPLTTSTKNFKMSQTSNKKSSTIPVSSLPKLIALKNITFLKSQLLVPKKASNKKKLFVPQEKLSIGSTSVIDLDSDDEPLILEANNRTNNNKNDINVNTNTSNEISNSKECMNKQTDINSNDTVENQSILLSSRNSTLTRTIANKSQDLSRISIDEVMKSIKTQQWNKKFKKLLLTQNEEIDNMLGQLKTKILKLVQIYNRNTKSHLQHDMIHTAAVCTQRFHRAVRKTLLDLSDINDRVVRDYVCWKKKTEQLMDNNNETENLREQENESTTSVRATVNNNLTLEMTCVRDSASESEDDENQINNLVTINMEANSMTDFPPILDNISFVKHKSTAVKCVGNDTVKMKDQACQVYDVPWKDYEKCIGYSLLTKVEYNSVVNEEVLNPVVLSDEHFGKYQEQYLYYLQHIEDCGIETEDLKGSIESSHIPFKDLIDNRTPFIMGMLERFNPDIISDRSALTHIASKSFSNDPSITNLSSRSLPAITNENSLMTNSSIHHHQRQKPCTSVEKLSTESNEIIFISHNRNTTAVLNLVENSVKTKKNLSEDLKNKQKIEENRTANKDENYILQKETLAAVNSIQNVPP